MRGPKHKWTIVRDGTPECPWVWHRVSPDDRDIAMGCVRHYTPADLTYRSRQWDAEDAIRALDRAEVLGISASREDSL